MHNTKQEVLRIFWILWSYVFHRDAVQTEKANPLDFMGKYGLKVLTVSSRAWTKNNITEV